MWHEYLGSWKFFPGKIRLQPVMMQLSLVVIKVSPTSPSVRTGKLMSSDIGNRLLISPGTIGWNNSGANGISSRSPGTAWNNEMKL